ncbi:TPA: GHMP kinase, partial [Klebsiella pneumoniae]|nr:GHMP kinase [Klebsiella pneumoniae]
SVVGLLLDRRRHDVEFLQWRLADSDIAAHWPQQHLLAMVPGGVILQ